MSKSLVFIAGLVLLAKILLCEIRKAKANIEKGCNFCFQQ